MLLQPRQSIRSRRGLGVVGFRRQWRTMMVSTPSFSETVKTSSSRSPIITHTTDKIERVSWFRTTTASASSGSARSTHGRRHSSSEGQTLIERTSSSRSVPACVAATIARQGECVALAVRRQRLAPGCRHGLGKSAAWPIALARCRCVCTGTNAPRGREGGGGEVEPVPSGGEVAAQASAAHLRHLLRETAQREACAGGVGGAGGGGTGRLAGGGGGGGIVGERRQAQSDMQRSRVTQPSPG